MTCQDLSTGCSSFRFFSPCNLISWVNPSTCRFQRGPSIICTLIAWLDLLTCILQGGWSEPVFRSVQTGVFSVLQHSFGKLSVSKLLRQEAW